MRDFLVFFILFSLFSCEKIVDKPKNLIEKQEMAEIIADFAIYDQTYTGKTRRQYGIGKQICFEKT